MHIEGACRGVPTWSHIARGRMAGEATTGATQALRPAQT